LTAGKDISAAKLAKTFARSSRPEASRQYTILAGAGFTGVVALFTPAASSSFFPRRQAILADAE